MFRSSPRLLSAASLLLIAACGAPYASQAAPSAPPGPGTDHWADRPLLTAANLPYTDASSNIVTATVDSSPADPAAPCLPVTLTETHTVWYGYTTGASTEYLTLTTTANKQIFPEISIYTGNTADGFTIVSGGCATAVTTSGSTQGNAAISGIRLAPNTSYSIMVGATSSVAFAESLNFKIDVAKQYLVTTTADSNDGSCTNALCSLRDAISASNASPGVVLIPAGNYALALTGYDFVNASGDLNVNSGMGIYGAGMNQTIIDAKLVNDHVISLDAIGVDFQTFILGDLTLQNGTTVLTANGGGIQTSSYVNYEYIGFERIAVLTSSATSSGGGIYLHAPGTIHDSHISGNTTGFSSNGGAGLYYIFDKNRYLEITGSTFSGNSGDVGSSGGGIYASGTLHISNSTVSGNHASAYGGGIDSENGALLMANTTVVLNSTGSAGSMYLGAGVYLNGGTGNGTTMFTNSIIAKNTLDPPFHSATDPPDCLVGSIDTPSTSYNIVPLPDNCTFSGTGDMTNAGVGHALDPMISPLADNGGPTPTHALIWGSIAIDAGDPGGCKDAVGADVLLVDQRGLPRPDGPRCDIGAFEYQNLIFKNGFEASP